MRKKWRESSKVKQRNCFAFQTLIRLIVELNVVIMIIVAWKNNIKCKKKKMADGSAVGAI